jgi:serine/threonine protein kinase/Tol biopolymer transport system component
MSMPPGVRLGPYEVLGLIGAGGMGEVYKACDTRLDRTVALKILPPELAVHPERRQRFEREAKAISQLSHPHICALYDVGEALLRPSGFGGASCVRESPSTSLRVGPAPSPKQDVGAGFSPEQDVGAGFSRPVCVSFLVMELLEGETLAARLEHGALPLDQALRMGADIADALAYAHRHGIVHRDLKPANVMLTASGVELLDFGLAKLRSGVGPLASGSGVTTTDGLTTEGRVLGTVPYMAPEQIEGKETDARTDIFALGCVLYEMVTGRRAFEGDTPAALMSAILKDEPPPLGEHQALAPLALDHVVRRCLAKDPDERWHSASDVKRELEWAGQPVASGPTSSENRVRVTWRTVGGSLATAGVAAALGFGAARVWFLPANRAARSPVARVRIVAAVAPVRSFGNNRMAISPDGSAIAYEGQDRDGTRGIYLRRLDTDEPVPVPGTERAVQPFFSPDGRWLGFFAFPEAMGSSTRLQRVLLPDGPPETIVPEVVNPGGAAWGPDDTIVFTDQAKAMALFRVPAGGGSPERLMQVDPDRGEWFLLSPRFVPNGRAVLVTASGSTCDGSRVLLQPLDGGPPHTLLENAGDAHVLPTGHLVFVRDGAVLVAPYDQADGSILGPGTPLGEQVDLQGLGCRSAALSPSNNGVLAYLPPGTPRRFRLVWVDRGGRELPANIGPAGEFAVGVRISPSGRSVTGMSSLESRSIVVVDLERNVPIQLTAASSWWPIWSPDGQHVAFSMARQGVSSIQVYWRRADGSAPIEQLTSGDLTQNPRAFTPDGKTLIYQQHVDPQTGFDIWSLSLEKGATPHPLLRERYNEFHPSLSPDGQWLAYVTDEAGASEVFVRSYPALDKMTKVSPDGGWAPVWSRDGRELYYLQSDLAGSRVFAVGVDTSSGFHASVPVLLFEGPYAGAGNQYGQSFDVAPDGRFLIAKLDESAPPPEIRLVLNWFEELKAKVPTS